MSATVPDGARPLARRRRSSHDTSHTRHRETRTMRRSPSRRCTATLEGMEERVCLSSVGWDGAGRGRAALTYYIGTAPSSLSQAAVTAAVKAALNVWSKVAAVTFTQTSQPNRPDSIDFTFRSLDGRGGTLAQSYF